MNITTSLSADQVSGLKSLGWSYDMRGAGNIDWWRVNYDVMVDGKPTTDYPGSRRWIRNLYSLIRAAEVQVVGKFSTNFDNPDIQKAMREKEIAEVKNPKDVAAVVHGAQATGDGIRKGYGPYNWREKPISLMEHLGAIERHIACIKDGEDYCKDSRVSHLGCINAGTAIILDAMQCDTLIDDRPKKPGRSAEELEAYRAKNK